jgi:hypothetical protein
MREINDKNVLDEFTIDFCRAVESCGIDYLIVSGFVAIAHGRSRGTEDIDIMIRSVSYRDFLVLDSALRSAGFECLYPSDTNAIYDELNSYKANIRYTRVGEELPNMEVKFAKDGLDEAQFLEKKVYPLTGLDIYFPKIEEVIAFKEELLRSEKDMEDAAHLRIIYAASLDEDYITGYKEKIRRTKV